MFETITSAPPDPIMGLTEAFKADPNPNKVNLGVGVYKDADGRTPVLSAVKMAEERIMAEEATKSYLPIDGEAEYAAATRALVFGADHPLLAEERAVTAQTPGGTGALRVAGDFIARMLPGATIWLSEPTWPNHPGVFSAAGLKVANYPYFDASSNGLAFEIMLERIRHIPEGDVLLLHGCCHNPTGVDLTSEQWRAVATTARERGILPLIDFAYQGFAEGLTTDARGVYAVAEICPEFLVASSYSKNFGLYNERVGALTLVAAQPESARASLSHIKRCIRTNYSNPPAHGSKIVTRVLTSPDLRRRWEEEVAQMRERINAMRDLFCETLDQKGANRDFSFIAQQRGMFSFSGLSAEQVAQLRERYAIYIVGSGRINVAGMTSDNMDYLCSAIADVLG